MKKFVSLMVAVMMLCCLTVTAFAATASAQQGTVDPKGINVADDGTVTVSEDAAQNMDSSKEYTITLGDVTVTLKYASGKWTGSIAADKAAAAQAAVAAAVTAGTAIATAPAAAVAGGTGPASFVVNGNGTATTGTAAGVSPQTGETVAVYAVAAVVMAAAAAAFVVKARKA